MLEESGWLPTGRHVVTADDFRTHFVDAFPDSATRARLYRRWEKHLAALRSVIEVEAQWIDGSFVTSKLDPGDIDLVNIVDGLAFDALPPGLRDMVEGLLSGRATKAVWGIDSYVVFRYPDGHPARPAADVAEEYWHHFWQSHREHDGVVKGYLEVVP